MSGWLEMLLGAAFMAGLLGGVHCAAMCGGIVGVLCSSGATGTQRPAVSRLLAYNCGRILSYVLAGSAVGALGQGGLLLRGTPALQQGLLLLAGATLILLALYMAGVTALVSRMEIAGAALWRRLQPCSRWFLPADTPARALGLGMIWGWLPCGMVYAVLLTALASGNALHGALVMLAFGIGTLPNLLALGLAASRMRQWLGRRGVRVCAALVIGGFGTYGMLHALQVHPAHDAGSLCTPRTADKA